jgi:sec-independent protein translocase protein TatC
MGVFGLIFEMPVPEMPVPDFLLARLGISSTTTLVHNRRYAIVIGTVLAAAITPTADPVNLALVAVTVIVLYKLTILTVRISEQKEERSERENPQFTPRE